MPEERFRFDQVLAPFETVLEHAPIGFAVLDREFRHVRVNLAAGAMLGGADAVLGRTVVELAPHLWPTLEPIYRRALAGETVQQQDVEMSFVPGRRVRHVLLNANPVVIEGAIVGIAVVVTDITARRVAEQTLARRNQLYAMLARASRAANRSTSTDALYQTLCDTAVDVGLFRFAWVGVPEEGIVRLVARAEAVPGPSSGPRVSTMDGDPLSLGPTGQALLSGAPRIVNDIPSAPEMAPWQALWESCGVRSAAAIPLLERGRVAAVFTLYSDRADYFTQEIVETLSEIMPIASAALDSFLAERERQRDEAELRLRDRAMQAVSQGIVIVDAVAPDAPVVYASPAFARMVGYPPEETVGRSIRLVAGPGTDPAAVAAIEDAFRERRATDVEALTYRKDGSAFWNATTVAPVRDADGTVTHFVGVVTDVTERRQLEERYRHAQKMEAIGQLAGGIAHDFNNLLTVIKGYSELLLNKPTLEPASVRELLTEINAAGDQAVSLTRQLLAFSRQQVIEARPLELNSVVGDTERMLRRLIGEDITFSTTLATGLGLVHADPAQLSQILINLVVNARDAMPTGGALSITTRSVLLDKAACAGRPGLTPGRFVQLEVTDTGHGMGAEIQARIFEPFFTTKPAGKGTGLGLATVHGIVAQAGGAISVRSEPNVGTTFTIVLPTVTNVESAGAPQSQPSTTTAITGETVLLVEDEQALRSLEKRMLIAAGYTVLEASNGLDAIEIAGRFDGPIHLLVSDVVMPHLGGRELADRVLASRPGCKVLFLSGYTDDAVLRHGVQAAEYAFLAKPFSVAALTAKVRSVLESA